MGEAGAKALATLSPEQQESTREEIRAAQEAVDKLSLQLSRAIGELKAVLSRLQDFGNGRSRLQQWLSDIEKRLQGVPIAKGGIAEVRMQLESYKVRMSYWVNGCWSFFLNLAIIFKLNS